MGFWSNVGSTVGSWLSSSSGNNGPNSGAQNSSTSDDSTFMSSLFDIGKQAALTYGQGYANKWISEELNGQVSMNNEVNGYTIETGFNNGRFGYAGGGERYADGTYSHPNVGFGSGSYEMGLALNGDMGNNNYFNYGGYSNGYGGGYGYNGGFGGLTGGFGGGYGYNGGFGGGGRPNYVPIFLAPGMESIYGGAPGIWDNSSYTMRNPFDMSGINPYESSYPYGSDVHHRNNCRGDLEYRGLNITS